MSEKESDRQGKKASIKKFVMWFVVILLLLGFILPAVSNLKKSVPFKMVCQTQMKTIGKCLLIYSCGDGCFPSAEMAQVNAFGYCLD